MTKILLFVAALADVALAALLFAVSGFLFGSGPDSIHAGTVMFAFYAAGVIACVAAPLAGFILNRNGNAGFGTLLAWLPPAGVLAAAMMPPPM